MADALPASLSPEQRRLVAWLGEELAGLPGAVAVALGGSHARGLARPDSDVDLGVYYRASAPLDTATLRRHAARWTGHPDPTVSDLGEWGPWVDGGAWLEVQGLPVDLLYREIGLLDATVDACLAGRVETHYGQQPPAGFHNHTLAGELAVCVPLADPEGELARLKARVARYPEELAAAVVRRSLDLADFTLLHARVYAAAGDVVNTVRCLARLETLQTQALFAANRAWFLNDKSAAAEIAGFAFAPPDYSEVWTRLLGAAGATPEELGASVGAAEALFDWIAHHAAFARRYATGKPLGRPPG